MCSLFKKTYDILAQVDSSIETCYTDCQNRNCASLLNTVFNKTANGVLFDVVCRLYQGFLYLELKIGPEIWKVWAEIHLHL